MKYLTHLVISLTILFISIIALFYTIQEREVYELDNILQTDDIDNTSDSYQKDDMFYIYTDDKDIYNIEQIGGYSFSLQKTYNTAYYFKIEPQAGSSSSNKYNGIIVTDVSDKGVKVDGYLLVGEVTLTGDDVYDIDVPKSEHFIYSTEYPHLIIKSYVEYSMIPVITGLFGLGYLFIAISSHANGSHDKYQQGYKKPQRGKREKY